MTEGEMSLEEVRNTLSSWYGGSEACLDVHMCAEVLGPMISAIDAYLTSRPEQDDGLTGAYLLGRHDGRKERLKAATDAQPVAWFPTYANGEILRFFSDGKPVQASTTKENAEKVRLFDIGTSGNPVVPLYAYSAPLQAVTLSEVLNALEEFAEQGACLHGDDTHRLRAIVARMTSSQAVGDGWKRMTEEARRIQMRHFDKHEGDVYHAMQSLCVKFGSRREDTMIEDIPAITPQPVATAGDGVTE